MLYLVTYNKQDMPVDINKNCPLRVKKFAQDHSNDRPNAALDRTISRITAHS
jgi:hypothetical protein